MNFHYRARLPSLEGNIMGIADGVARFNRMGGGFEVGTFLKEFDWNNLGVSAVDVGKLEIKVVSEGKVGLFREGQRLDEGAIQRAMREGDLLSSIREMKFETSEAVVNYANTYKQVFRQSDGYLAGKEMDTIKHSNLPEPTTEIELANQLNGNKALEARVSKSLDKMKERIDASGNVQVGKWLKRTVVVGFASLGLAWFYNKVTEHQKLMNGCWLLKMGSSGNTKCKLESLCCRDADTISAEVAALLCSPQQSGLECGAGGCCVAYETGQCVKTLGEKCDSGLCHPACSQTANIIEVPSPHRLVCVEMNFWDAAEDFVDETLDAGKSMVEWILTMAMTALFIYIVYKMVSSSSTTQGNQV